MTRVPRPPLARFLAVRMAAAAAAVTLALLIVVTVQYLLDPEELAHKTLTDEATAIAAALAAGHDPATWPHYVRHPDAYAYRVFDKQLPRDQRKLSEANAGLLPPLSATASGDDDPVLRLDERFAPLPPPAGPAGTAGWTQTTLESVGGRGYWVQLAMVGDPAWRQRLALRDELLSHVFIPALFQVLALTSAMLLATRLALRPLARVAQQARRLGATAARGGALRPLTPPPLPREIDDLVGALNVAIGELDEALARQRQFASDAAHELRTPLSVLRLQLAKFPPGPLTTDMAEELSALSHLVDQLLRFAQAEGAMMLDRKPIDLVATVREVCEDLVALAVQRGQALEFDAPAVAVMLPSQPALVQVAVRNLVANAMHASAGGTTIVVRVAPDGRVIVDDQGPGIPDANKALIFERLWRADGQRGGGAGIGLALVRRIAQLHGGKVTVEDRPGGGARFTLHLLAPAQDR